MNSDWMGAEALAALMGVTRRAVSKAIKTGTLRRHPIIARTVPGRGGRAGLRYEVRVDSLPPDLQLRHRQLVAAELDPSVLRSDEAAGGWRTWWAVTLGPALAHRRRSPDRAAAIVAIAGRKHVTPHGLSRFYDEATIRRWLRKFEAYGVPGLHKRAPRPWPAARRHIGAMGPGRRFR